jgi:2-enoate reductase
VCSSDLHPQCSVNPRSSFEFKLPEIPPPADLKKRVAVVGAGPAGVVAALTAAQRGHQVDLYEQTAEVGGRMVSGTIAAMKFDMDNYRQYLIRQIDLAKTEFGMGFYPESSVDALFLKQQGYDAAIFAVGTKDIVPPIPGIEEATNVVQATELFQHPEKLLGVQEIIIVGGGAVGCELAQWLAYECNRHVTVIEMLPYIMDGVCTANRTHILHALRSRGVTLLNMTKMTGLERNAVTVSRNYGKNVPNPYNTWNPVLPENIENPLAPKIGNDWREETLTADLIVLAMGGRADDSLYFTALKERSAKELYNIGDSFAAGKVMEAVRAGYRLGISI